MGFSGACQRRSGYSSEPAGRYANKYGTETMLAR